MPLFGRDTWVTGPFPRGVLLLESLSGGEALGRLFGFELGLLSSESTIDADAVLGKPMAVGMRLDSGDERFFHGLVTSFRKVGATQLHTRYQVVLRPRMRLLGHASDCRIFNQAGQTALDIVTAVLAERGVTDVDAGALSAHAYRRREYCVQYRESDLNFVERLLEDEGIYCFFKHAQAKHILVLADSIAAHEKATGYASVPYFQEARHSAGSEEHFWNLHARRSLYPGRHTVLTGYHPTELRRKQPEFGRSTSEELVAGYEFEHYDDAGALTEPAETQDEANRRRLICAAANRTIEVDGNTMGLGTGDLVSLRKGADVPFWTDQDFAKTYLVVAADYEISIDQYETGHALGMDQPFRAHYRLLDADVPFHPQRIARKPVIPGPQTALVVGPAGEEIWTDELGCVMVQFDWDRLGKRNEKSSCWVRVGQPWAGSQWGGIRIPRIGQEVMVRFLDGDPDRPVIAGQLYNADQMPPYELPEHKTQSGIKSRSSKNGSADNFNEIRFEDLNGREALHVQAERDMSTLVKHCQDLQVGANRSIEVGHDETNQVRQDRDHTVDVNDSVVVGGTHDKTVVGKVTQIYGGDHSRKVDGDQELFAEQNKDEHVGKAHTLTTDKKFRLNQGATSMTFKNLNVSLSSAGVITMLAGGATISIDQTGLVTLDSPTGIKLESGSSSLAVLPGGVALSSPAITAATAAGTTMAMGKEALAMSGKRVAIEAQGVCKIQGQSKLKLQESEGKKAKQDGKSADADEVDAAVRARRPKQKQAAPDSTSLGIHVVDLDGKPQAGLAFQIKKPDGSTQNGKLDKAGRGTVKSAKPGKFAVTFPDLDGGDWDGDGADKLKERSEASKVKATSEDRVPAIARDKGFLNWRTVWNFAGNADLRKLRENPNLLCGGDMVAIPSKLKREARVVGGGAEFVVQQEEERIVTLRLLDAGQKPLAGARYQSKTGDPNINRGVVPEDGWVTVAVPRDAGTLVLDLYLSGQEDGHPLAMRFDVHDEPLGDTTEHKNQRLLNLGLVTEPPDGAPGEDEDAAVALARHRAMLGKQADDEELLDDLTALHDGGEDEG